MQPPENLLRWKNDADISYDKYFGFVEEEIAEEMGDAAAADATVDLEDDHEVDSVTQHALRTNANTHTHTHPHIRLLANTHMHTQLSTNLHTTMRTCICK